MFQKLQMNTFYNLYIHSPILYTHIIILAFQLYRKDLADSRQFALFFWWPLTPYMALFVLLFVCLFVVVLEVFFQFFGLFDRLWTWKIILRCFKSFIFSIISFWKTQCCFIIGPVENTNKSNYTLLIDWFSKCKILRFDCWD